MNNLQWMRRVRDSDLPPCARLVAIAVALRANRQGQCWPAFGLLAADTGLSRRTVITHVGTLEGAGWLNVAARANGHGDQTNSYQLTYPQGGAGAALGGVQEMHPLVQELHPLGGAGAAPRSTRPNEVLRDTDPTPVDNPHLRALIGGLADKHRIPR